MTTSQTNTVNQIVARIERLNGKQRVSMHNILKGHISLLVFNVRDNVDFVRTTIYCDIIINTKGNVVKGFANEYTPKTETKYPYMNL
jgi:hypothetical protein